MANQTLDFRKILHGDKGELYSGDGEFLANVNRFQAQINITNTDYQPAGSQLVVAVMANYNVTLVFTETVVRSDMLKKLLDELKAGRQPVFHFQGVIRGTDGDERQIFRNCVPDGNIDLMNIQVGEIIERAWSWRVNSPPALQELLR